MTKEEILKIKNYKIKEHLMLEYQRNINHCCKCGESTENNRIGLWKHEVNSGDKKICNLCEECYLKLLDYLEVIDV